MPYDAPNYQTVYYDDRGSPYWMTAGGKKHFVPPLTAAQMRDEPRAMAWAKSRGAHIDYQTGEDGQTSVGPGGVTNTSTPGGSLLRERGTWDSEDGDWDRPINWSNIMSMGVGGMMAAPLMAGALGGAAGAGGGAGGAVGAAAPVSATSLTGMGTLPAGLAGGSGMAAGGAATGAGVTGSSLLSKLASPDALTGYADVLGGMAGAGANKNASQDSLKVLMERNKLDRDKHALEAPGSRMKTGLLASLAGNFKPTTVDWGEGGFTPGMGAAGKRPTISGGMSGGMANLDPQAKQLSQQVMHDSLVSQLRGGETGGGTSPETDATGYDREMDDSIGQTSGMDKAVGGMATGASILAALRKAYGRK